MTGRKDPEGKRALFEAPPIEIEDTLRDDPLIERHGHDGHEALYSAGDREPGTTAITCSSCKVRSRISIIETFVRILSISMWDPRRSYTRWMQCPACQTRAWCKVEWLG
ncbi:hypothetical protein MNBD_ACTINO01-276 [hydrothermal vent metagenome]|uniref:Uncharacterized protein n=1 Tax=hydrothermal vent metagenome TaxID=652676 RepID=A0A3B0SQV5_9ZZZZ